jgi:hypothetical protein
MLGSQAATRPSSEAGVHWSPDLLDLEPEVCHCVAHGHELPCPDCQKPNTRKDS